MYVSINLYKCVHLGPSSALPLKPPEIGPLHGVRALQVGGVGFAGGGLTDEGGDISYGTGEGGGVGQK